ncbi:MAG: dihydropteroate synthase [Bacteroidota bacterium]
MIIQLVDIFYPNVFRRYGAKYNIFRNLYEKDLLGLEIRDIDFKFAQKVKKIILTNEEICYLNIKENKQIVDLLALGSYGVFKELAKEIIALGNEDVGFKIKKVIQSVNEYENNSFSIAGKCYGLEKTYLMGILNVTPDSFSDGGKYYQVNDAVKHGIQLLEDGADILDIGGESSRPGSKPITAEEEIKRVVPVIEKILEIKPDAVISIDTMKSNVAEETLKLGAKIVNDISAFENDKNMLDVVKKYDAALILMHMKGTPENMQENPSYEDVVSEIYDYLVNKTEIAKRNGVKDIIIDPGIGFGKRVIDNYEIIKRLNEFKGIGYPIMLGLSKKSFIGKTLNLATGDREEPTIVAEAISIKNGARIIRTHNIKKAKVAMNITQFIENPELVINV